MIRFGVSPIAWSNDDLPELGGDTAIDTILADARDLGFEGIELGGRFPRDPVALATLLDRYGLALAGGWYSTALLDRDVDAEMAALAPHLDLLRRLGVATFIAAETSNAVHCDRTVGLGRSPRLTADQWPLYCDRLSDLGRRLAAEGLRLAVHHHLGTVVENGDDLDRLLRTTDPAVGIVLDTGHAALGGVDAAATVRRFPDRIAHVHCKDVRRDVHGAVPGAGSFLDGVIAGMFTVPGDGDLDFAPVMQALRDIGYAGWIVVEAEQDPAIADPRTFGAIGYRHVADQARAAGLIGGAKERS